MLLFGGSMAVTCVYIAIRHTILGVTAQTNEPPGGTQLHTLATMPAIILRYLALSLWPARLEIEYDWIKPATGADPVVLGGLAATVTLLAAAWSARRRVPAATFGIAWFFIALLPFLQIIPINRWMAVRFLYIPLAGAGIAAAAATENLLAGRRIAWRDYPAKNVVAGFAIAAMTFASLNQTFVWKNDLTFWEHQYNMRPDSTRRITSYADNLARFKFYDEALTVLEDFQWGRGGEFEELAWRTRIDALLGGGHQDDALAAVRQAATLLPDSEQILVRRAFIEEQFGDSTLAIPTWERVLQIDPNNRYALQNLPRLYDATGEIEKAGSIRARLQRIEQLPRSQW
jgi:tetratricopeptide (TPR) repeat protein